MNIQNFVDVNKKGTIIVSTYRSGTHYLLDNINAYLTSKCIPVLDLGELESAHIPESSKHVIGIINAVIPKITLVKDQDLLKDYNLVKLTRNNKIEHWISYHIWKQFNTAQQRLDNSNLPHHGGSRNQYNKLSAMQCNVPALETWLMEQMIVHLFRANVSIDYSDLQYINGADIKWNANDYNLSLEDLFTNHNEVKSLLSTYKVPDVEK